MAQYRYFLSILQSDVRPTAIAGVLTSIRANEQLMLDQSDSRSVADTAKPRGGSIVRSIGAVFAGLLFIVVGYDFKTHSYP